MAQPTAQLLALADFNDARLDEDEAAARRHSCALECMERIHSDWHRVQLARERGDTVERLTNMGLGLADVGSWRPAAGHTTHPSRMRGTALDPDRILREVAAKRLLVANWRKLVQQIDTEPDPETRERLALTRHGLDQFAFQLAAVHANHPDYQEGWRP